MKTIVAEPPDAAEQADSETLTVGDTAIMSSRRSGSMSTGDAQTSKGLDDEERPSPRKKIAQAGSRFLGLATTCFSKNEYFFSLSLFEISGLFGRVGNLRLLLEQT